MPCCGQGGQIVGPIVPSQNATVDLGVQGFHPAIEHLRKAGILGHVAHRHPFVFEKLPVPPVL